MPTMVLLIAAGQFAYIDPNSGGWLFQMLFPIFVAVGGAFLVLRSKAAALWKRFFGRDDKGPDDSK